MNLKKTSSKVKLINACFAILLLSMTLIQLIKAEEKKAFTTIDAMKFKAIVSPVISDNGAWIAYYTQPDRGDSRAIIQSAHEFVHDTKYVIERGVKPIFTHNAKWVGMIVKPPKIESINADKDKSPKDSMAILNTSNGDLKYFENIKGFVFSEDSKWMIYKLASDNKPPVKKDEKKIIGDEIVLRHLSTGAELPIQNVTNYAFDSVGNYLVYVVAESSGKRNGLYYIKLQGMFNFPQKIMGEKNSHFSNLTWNYEKSMLAFLLGREKSNGAADTCSLMLWHSRSKELTVLLYGKDSLDNSVPKDLKIPFHNKLKWSEDGNRIFFGFKSVNDTSEIAAKVKFEDTTFFNIDTILQKRKLDVWHWDDPRIKTHQKVWWKNNEQRTYQAVYHLDVNKWVQLADINLPNVEFTDNPNYALGYDDTPYLKEITWNGWFNDIYKVDLNTGLKSKIAEKIVGRAYLSPQGNYIAYFNNKHWQLHDCKADSTTNLTSILEGEIPFYNTEFDEPTDAPSYGLGGWIEKDAGLILYDKYDIWKFYTNGGGYINLTAAEGRLNKITFRIKNLDTKRKYYKQRENVLVYATDENKKTRDIYRINFSILGTEKVLREDNKKTILSKAKDTYKILYIKNRYDLFPDLWVSDSTFSFQLKLSDVNPEMKDFNWGKTELTEWVNSTGDTLKGWIIKPDSMEPDKKYPMLVYFYDKFSNYYNNFFQPKINHRPCFPIYTGKGYVIFLPDIKYHVGIPGFDAVDCIVSGVRHVINKGYIDSTAIGIQGHSWGGYQTAFLITQTNIFSAAIAGAPVGNMTSAYSGIRLGSGLARQFQYEKFQSRIGGDIWDSLDNYLNNSPIFQAKTIKTPFLLMFGDKDQAVPWEQGIELYLAMRRLNKKCIFLQYRGEPHWPMKYANKLDYSIKMMEFFDHYLLGRNAPEWLTKGVEFRGK